MGSGKSSTQKGSKRPQPYNSHERPRLRQAQPPRRNASASSSTSMTSVYHSSLSQSSSVAPSSSRQPLSLSRSLRPLQAHSTQAASPSISMDFSRSKRGYILDRVRRRFPNYTPLNDFEVFALGVSDDVVPEHELRQWLDAKFAEEVSTTGDPEIPISRAREFLDSPGGITGCKPREDTPNVFVRAIPDSDYSLRLFPGNIALQEYCADFVRTSAGQPVNRPPDFELWPAPTGPAGLALPSGRLRSLDDTFSSFIRSRPVQRSETETDTFVLRDGQSYVLRRPGQRNVRFTVPNRQDVDEGHDDHVLDFPVLAL